MKRPEPTRYEKLLQGHRAANDQEHRATNALVPQSDAQFHIWAYCGGKLSRYVDEEGSVSVQVSWTSLFEFEDQMRFGPLDAFDAQLYRYYRHLLENT